MAISFKATAIGATLEGKRWKFVVYFADGRKTRSVNSWASERSAVAAGRREFGFSR